MVSSNADAKTQLYKPVVRSFRDPQGGMVSFGHEGLKIVRLVSGFYDISMIHEFAANLSSIKHDRPPPECLKSIHI